MSRRISVGVALGAAIASALAPTLAEACPSCPVGVTARQQVFDQDFGTNLLVAAIPFLLVGLVSRWAERLRSGTAETGAMEK